MAAKQRSRKILILLFFAATSGEASTHSDCYGPEGAKIGMVYLHGLETPLVSNLEKENHVILQKLSQDLNLRIAAPRSEAKCPAAQMKLCWPKSKNKDLKETLAWLEKRTKACLAKQTEVGAFGFSNGGWFLNKLVIRCYPNSFKWLMSLGAGGGLAPESPQNLQNCGTLKILIGNTDKLNQIPSRNLHRQLLSRKAKVTFLEYKGHHALSYPALKAALTELTGQQTKENP